jgi:hypothetical protein
MSASDDKPSKANDNAAASGGRAPAMTLLDKIKQTLASTSPDRWEEAGEPLDPSKKFQKPQETWEHLYCTDAKAGVLVLRCSTPVTSNFFGGGYSFVESSVPRFMIELRGRGWAPKMLVDPFYRSSGAQDKNYQVLAEGDVAKQLYFEVEASLRQYRTSLKRDFNDSVERLIANVREQVQETASTDWKQLEGEQGYTGYRGDVNGMTVTIACTVRDRVATYTMNFMKYGMRWDCRDSTVMRDVFKIVDDSVRQASLEQLGKVLEDML